MTGPRWQHFDTADALAGAASDLIADRLRTCPDCVLGLPTGRTPLATYAHLLARDDVSLNRAHILGLDEYVGLGAEDAGSFHRYLEDRVARPAGLSPDQWSIPDGRATDPDREADRYDALIEGLGGIDLLVLGVGTNGHIGFNEPGAPLDSRTRVVTLARDTLAANFPGTPPETRPTRAITIGLATILEARRILLIASGPQKAPPLRLLKAGRYRVDCPVTALAHHAVVTVMTHDVTL